jgi:ubiquinol oxidase
MPYFAYTSCLHLYSTLGWWRSADLMNIHYSEQVGSSGGRAVF